jgi:hypothetical protein
MAAVLKGGSPRSTTGQEPSRGSRAIQAGLSALSLRLLAVPHPGAGGCRDDWQDKARRPSQRHGSPISATPEPARDQAPTITKGLAHLISKAVGAGSCRSMGAAAFGPVLGSRTVHERQRTRVTTHPARSPCFPRDGQGLGAGCRAVPAGPGREAPWEQLVLSWSARRRVPRPKT